MRCSPHSPGFSQSNPQNYNFLIITFSFIFLFTFTILQKLLGLCAVVGYFSIKKIDYYTYTFSFTCDVLIHFCAHFLLYLSIYPLILFSFNCIIKRSIFLSILENLCQHSLESSRAFPGIFTNIPQNLLEHSPESLLTFPGIFLNIPRNIKIIAFPGILVNISHVPRTPRIPFLIPVFLVLQIAFAHLMEFDI